MKCGGSNVGPCPDSRSGLGVRKYGDKKQCEACHDKDGSEPSSNDLEINELLCYISNRHEDTNKSDLVKICKNFYKEDEINSAKRELFDLYTGDQANIAQPHTDNADSTINTLYDIITLIRRRPTGDE